MITVKKTEYGTVYETIDELINADIESLYEDRDNYYFHLIPECFCENAVWVVNKQTREVSYMMFTEFIFDTMYKTNAKKIDLQTLKRAG